MFYQEKNHCYIWPITVPSTAEIKQFLLPYTHHQEQKSEKSESKTIGGGFLFSLDIIAYPSSLKSHARDMTIELNVIFNPRITQIL